MTAIRLERIVPLDVPDAAVCEDGVCEIPEARASRSAAGGDASRGTGPATAGESAR
jgi:hypothetical protein